MRRAVLLALFALVAASGAHAAGSACPTSNGPNELVLAGGSGQMGQLGKPFSQNLSVKLANTNGCALTGNLGGVTVEFDAPGSGPSGIFNGSRFAVVGTDANGVATAPPFTANFTVGNYSVDAHSDYGTVTISLSNTANGLAAAIAPQDPTSREAAVNAQYTQPLQVRVTDANGTPVQGASVSFAIVPGATGAGASFLGGGQATAVTNADGTATSPPLLANGSPGKFTATAATDGLSAVATFALDNHGATTTIQTLATGNRKSTVDARFHQSLQARVLDSSGSPLEGATVTFAIAAADNGAGAGFLGGAAQATALTDAAGLAVAPPLIANKTAGTYTATAAVPGAQPVTFRLENRAAKPTSIVAGAASGESTTARMHFPIRLAVTVTDKNGNAVAGATVTFAAPAKGASGLFSKHGHRRRVAVKTNGKGIAVAPPFVADASTGGYAVTAAVKGTSLRAAFSLLNLPRG
jgi:protocatechuate 3,4-dioxygenase beta subunit